MLVAAGVVGTANSPVGHIVRMVADILVGRSHHTVGTLHSLAGRTGHGYCIAVHSHTAGIAGRE